MKFRLLELVALGGGAASAVAIEDRQAAFQPNLVIDKLNLAYTAFNTTMYPKNLAGAPTDYTSTRLLLDLPVIQTLMGVDAIALVTNVVPVPLADEVETLLCEAMERVLIIEQRFATRLDNVIQNNHGPLNSDLNLPTVATELTNVRKAVQRVANILDDTLKVLPQCGKRVKQEERQINREFAGLILTMHQKPNAVTTTVANKLLDTLNITGGVTGSALLAISGKPSKRSSNLWEEVEKRAEEEDEMDGELSG